MGFGSPSGNKQIDTAGLRGPVEQKYTSKILFSVPFPLAKKTVSVASSKNNVIYKDTVTGDPLERRLRTIGSKAQGWICKDRNSF